MACTSVNPVLWDWTIFLHQLSTNSAALSYSPCCCTYSTSRPRKASWLTVSVSHTSATCRLALRSNQPAGLTLQALACQQVYYSSTGSTSLSLPVQPRQFVMETHAAVHGKARVTPGTHTLSPPHSCAGHLTGSQPLQWCYCINTQWQPAFKHKSWTFVARSAPETLQYVARLSPLCEPQVEYKQGMPTHLLTSTAIIKFIKRQGVYCV